MPCTRFQSKRTGSQPPQAGRTTRRHDQPAALSRAGGAKRKDQLPCTGREAYFDRYAPVATGIVLANGGRVFWLGKVLATVVGPAEEQWHDALLVEYPDFECLQRVFREPAYQAIVFHRTAALEDSRLIATATIAIG